MFARTLAASAGAAARRLSPFAVGSVAGAVSRAGAAVQPRLLAARAFSGSGILDAQSKAKLEALGLAVPSDATPAYVNGVVQKLAQQVADSNKLLNSEPLQDAEQISHIAFAFMASKALFAALDIQLFTLLAARDGNFQPGDPEHPGVSFDDISAALPTVPPQSLRTLLTALTSTGLLVSTRGGQRFHNSPAATAFLVRGAKYDFGDYLRFQIDKQMYPFLDHLVPVLTGQANDGDAKNEQKFLNYEQWMADPEEARLYTESQHSGSTGPARSLARNARSELERCRRLLDVGGGSGGFSMTLAKAFPELHATVLDFPNVCAVGQDFLALEDNADVAERVSFLGGNAVTSDFPKDNDAVLMSYLSSSIGGHDMLHVYTKAFEATLPGGTLFIHDFMVENDFSGPPLTSLWALQHMVFTPGAVGLTPDYVTQVMHDAGWRDMRVMPLIPGLTKCIIGTRRE